MIPGISRRLATLHLCWEGNFEAAVEIDVPSITDTRLSDFTFTFHFHFSLSCTGEGSGSPLQYSCLENPRDGSLVGCSLWGHTELDTTDVTASSSSSSTLGVGDGQGGLECCDSWGRKELDTTEQLNWTELNTAKAKMTAQRHNEPIDTPKPTTGYCTALQGEEIQLHQPEHRHKLRQPGH